MKFKKSFNNLFKKNLFYQILLLVVLVGVISFLKLSSNLSDNNTSNLATLVINFETEKRFFEGEVIKDMTILDALNAAISVGKIRLNYIVDADGDVNVMEIDGHTNGINGKYFVFYLNSTKVAPKDLNREVIHNSDSIEIRNE
ncbi:MAG: hypothetical protein Q7K55_08210 [Candidatus Levybacteria bacterium]|nr:hypothetical protein [Candidatus Levybacteria bacterium]